MTLVEPLLRRTTFLEEAVAALACRRVEVVRARAEALHGSRTFDVVTSRAVAPLGRLLGWSMPLVAATGALIAMKGSSVGDEIETSRADLERWGCGVPEVHVLGAGLVDSDDRGPPGGLGRSQAGILAAGEPAEGRSAGARLGSQAWTFEPEAGRVTGVFHRCEAVG